VDDFHWLGIHGVKDLILIGALLLPSVAPASQQGFGFRVQAICFCIIVTIFDYFLIVILK
jgi:hypothetical protein